MAWCTAQNKSPISGKEMYDNEWKRREYLWVGGIQVNMSEKVLYPMYICTLITPQSRCSLSQPAQN